MGSKLELLEYLGLKYLSVCYIVSSSLNYGWDFSPFIKFFVVQDCIVLILLPCIFIIIRALSLQIWTWPKSILLITDFFPYILWVWWRFEKIEYHFDFYHLCHTSLRVSFYWMYSYIACIWWHLYARYFYSIFEAFFLNELINIIRII